MIIFPFILVTPGFLRPPKVPRRAPTTSQPPTRHHRNNQPPPPYEPLTPSYLKSKQAKDKKKETKNKMSDQQVSLPFLLILLVTVGLATRYFFFSGPAPPAARGGRDAGAARRREAAAERVLQMFPQAERRAVLWDLARNGGSVQVTCERILAGRLETVGSLSSSFPFVFCGVTGTVFTGGGG